MKAELSVKLKLSRNEDLALRKFMRLSNSDIVCTRILKGKDEVLRVWRMLGDSSIKNSIDAGMTENQAQTIAKLYTAINDLFPSQYDDY